MEINVWLYYIIYIILYCFLMVSSFIFFIDITSKYVKIYPHLCDGSMFLYMLFVVLSIEFVVFDLVENYTFNKIKK